MVFKKGNKFASKEHKAKAQEREEREGRRNRKRLVTDTLIRSLKQFEHTPDDLANKPANKLTAADRKRIIKRNGAVRHITDNLVELAAVKGDKWAIQFIIERVEGKAKPMEEQNPLLNGAPSISKVSIEFVNAPEVHEAIDITPAVEKIGTG